MKKAKRALALLSALVLAVTMLVGLSVTSFAATATPRTCDFPHPHCHTVAGYVCYHNDGAWYGSDDYGCRNGRTVAGYRCTHDTGDWYGTDSGCRNGRTVAGYLCTHDTGGWYGTASPCTPCTPRPPCNPNTGGPA